MSDPWVPGPPSKELQKRLDGSPELDRLDGYTMFRNSLLREIISQAKATEAELTRLRELEALAERAQPQMIGEDAQPLPEWEWYFDELEALNRKEKADEQPGN